MHSDIEEIWKPINIDPWNGMYEASNLGRIRVAPRIISQQTGAASYKGYKLCILSKNGHKAHSQVHRLVAAAFHGEGGKDMTVNHKNRDRSDNRPENLEWVSRGDNVRHGLDNGGGTMGTRNGNNIADPADVYNLLKDKHPLSAIGRKLGVSLQAISQMRKRYRARGIWTDV